MESVDITLCSKLTEASIDFISQNCAKLKSLKAAYCSSAITDESLTKLAKGCPNLSMIDISYCKTITDEGVEGFLQSKFKFSKILINGLESLTSLGVISLLKHSFQVLVHLEMGILDPVIEQRSIL